MIFTKVKKKSLGEITSHPAQACKFTEVATAKHVAQMQRLGLRKDLVFVVSARVLFEKFQIVVFPISFSLLQYPVKLFVSCGKKHGKTRWKTLVDVKSSVGSA